jgi:hypothetical protein
VAAVMAMDSTDDTELFENTEDEIRFWVRWRAQWKRSVRLSLTVPKHSSTSRMIDESRVHEPPRAPSVGKRLKKQRRQRVRRDDGVRAWLCSNCGTIYLADECPGAKCKRDPKDAAIELGYAAPDLTARGKHDFSSAPPAIKTDVPSRVAAMTEIVKGLEDWMRDVVDHAYEQDLPDRISARLLRMPREDFTRWRRATVAFIATQLAYRREAAVRSASPIRRG